MKPIVAIAMGGYSSEYAISIESGNTVYNALIHSEFTPVKVIIAKEGWNAEVEGEKFLIDKNDFSFVKDGNKVTFDVVFNAIHGTPGEDGLFCAYLELIGLKNTSSKYSESALTFHKSKTNIVAAKFGINCPKGLYFSDGQEIDIDTVVEKLGLPVFVKPSRSGSSYGVSKVQEMSEFKNAIAEAKKEDPEILIEAAVIGREMGCGLVRINGEIQVLAITEILSKNSFFDYQAKYEGASEEITPAEISADLEQEISEIAKKAYLSFGLSGIARADFIVEENTNKPVFIEVNTVPGLSGASIVPQQIESKGIELKDFFTLVLQETLRD